MKVGSEASGLLCATSTIVSGALAFLGGVLIALVIIAAVFPSRKGQASSYRRVTGQRIPAQPG